MLTTLSLASSCLTETWLSLGSETGTAVVLGNPYDTNCWHASSDLTRTISPAICPPGYRSACDASSPRDDSETVWACCPSGFHCDVGYYACLSDATPGRTQTYDAITTDILGNTITTQHMTDGGINAHSVRVAFHSSDLAMLLPTASSYQATLTVTSTIPTSASETDIPTTSPGNLSVGATVGVGIGVGAAVLLLGVIAGLAWRRYRRRKQVAVDEDDNRTISRPDLSQVRGLSSTAISEMNGAPGLYELETKTAGKSPQTVPT